MAKSKCKRVYGDKEELFGSTLFWRARVWRGSGVASLFGGFFCFFLAFCSVFACFFVLFVL